MKTTNQLQSDKLRNDNAGISGCVKLTPAFSLASQQTMPAQQADIQNDQNIATQHDSLLGLMMGETFLGEVFGEAINDALSVPAWAQQIDVSTALDGYDLYMRDRAGQATQAEKQQDLTRGFFALGQPNAVRGLFNDIGNAASALIRDAGRMHDMGAPDAWVISAMSGGTHMAAPRI